MALFLSGSIHQGDELFSADSRGKQCAFITLSALLTARNIPLIQWSETTIYNILVQGDQMYLKALNNGLINLNPGVEYLSVDDLPKFVCASYCRNIFSYQIFTNISPVQGKVISPLMMTNGDNLPLVIEPIEVENNIDLPVVVEQNNIDLPVVVAQNNIDLPVVVAQNDIDLPVVVAQNNIDLPVVVAQNNIDLPVVVAQNNIDLPVVVAQNNIDLPVVVAQNDIDLPVVVAQNNIDLPVVVAQNNIDLPVVVEQNNIDLPVVVAQNTHLPIVVEGVQTENEKQMLVIHYGKDLQGLVISDQEIGSPYYDIHTALLNSFLNNSYAILVLEGYMMAIIKQIDSFYLFDSHARDSSGMPDPNGTAVVIKFTNILELEQYVYCLSLELHTNIYEIVPVQINNLIPFKEKNKCENDREYQRIKRCSLEHEVDKKTRLRKAREYKKRKQSGETDQDRLTRLQKVSECKKRKQSEESEKRIRLQEASETRQTKRSQKTNSKTQITYQKQNLSTKLIRTYQKQKCANRVSQPQQEISQQDYLNMFDIAQNGSIEEQSWAKGNLNKFHKSVQYTVSQCTVCHEAWPLKSKPESPYVCSIGFEYLFKQSHFCDKI
jgi:hypothetical protein